MTIGALTIHGRSYCLVSISNALVL